MQAGCTITTHSQKRTSGKFRGSLDAEERARLDAKVVRLFKQHRRITHQQLMQHLQELTGNHLSQGSTGEYQGWKPEAIKTCLEGLMSKEYIIRDETDR